jgi:hypothetical protein
MIFLSILLALGSSLHAAGLSYLPRNEDIEMVSRNRPVTLREFYCDAAQRLLQRAQSCQACSSLKVQCPSCCLANPNPSRPCEAIRCRSAGDPFGTDPAVNCDARPLFSASCSQTAMSGGEQNLFNNCGTTNIPGAQRRGCPSLTPEDPSASPVMPDFQGCGSILSEFDGDYFDTLPPSSPGGPPRAAPTNDYRDFVMDCRARADARERCAKQVQCCTRGVCGSGYNANCIESQCQARVLGWERANRTVETITRGNRECWDLTDADCIALNEEAQNCLNDVAGGTCGGCFRRIYDDFSYKFVAKSGEKIALMWRLYTTSIGDTSQNDYFYSKIHIEDAAGRVIASTPVHQKVFAGSFGVFSTIAVTPEMVRVGEEYHARLYYFINQNNSLNLVMNVTGAEIVAIKAKE